MRFYCNSCSRQLVPTLESSIAAFLKRKTALDRLAAAVACWFKYRKTFSALPTAPSRGISFSTQPWSTTQFFLTNWSELTKWSEANLPACFFSLSWKYIKFSSFLVWFKEEIEVCSANYKTDALSTKDVKIKTYFRVLLLKISRGSYS